VRGTLENARVCARSLHSTVAPRAPAALCRCAAAARLRIVMVAHSSRRATVRGGFLTPPRDPAGFVALACRVGLRLRLALLGTIHSRLATRDRRRRDRRRNRRSALLAQRHVHSASHQRPRAAQGRQPAFLREFVESSKGWGWLPTHADGDMTCDATCDAPCDVRVVL
jgi:hypothetical protein